jgi:hypothetical protein
MVCNRGRHTDISFIFTLQLANMKAQENQEGTRPNERYQLLVYANRLS